MVEIDRRHLETDVLVIGAGAAGLYAAIAAARDNANVLLLDRSLVGRSGATVMAQMTVAAALGHEETDDWQRHLADTLEAGRGLSNEVLARILCRDAPARILEMADWNVGWARNGNQIKQVTAPGHSVARCVYVDFLNTGPAVSRTLRTRVNRYDAIRRVSDLAITDLVVDDRHALGAVGYHRPSGAIVSIQANATILATGGLTRLFQRNSASANMGGDGYALALRAGAELVDMEFVQFFPIGHLAPRLIGMDPIMWDPFRYKLGGRLLNADMQEFTERYGVAEDGRYVATRDLATYAIIKEVEAGRGSPHGGAYLSFEHVPESELREAFGPVIDSLARNDIDLTCTPIEVAPIAHYHMGGVVVDARMQSRISGLFAAGEVVGGPNGANRLSGNAVTEALVYGERAGRFAAEFAGTAQYGWSRSAVEAALQRLAAPTRSGSRAESISPTTLIAELQSLMDRDVGPFRSKERLELALNRIRQIDTMLPDLRPAPMPGHDPVLIDWFDLANMVIVAESITLAALTREESRGAHQREDFPSTDPAWAESLCLSLENETIRLRRMPVVRDGEREVA